MMVLHHRRLRTRIPRVSLLGVHRTELIILAERRPFQFLRGKKVLLRRKMLMLERCRDVLRLWVVGG